MAPHAEARAACAFCCVKTLVEMQNRIIYKVRNRRRRYRPVAAAVARPHITYCAVLLAPLAQDARVFGMLDRNPRAATHLLVIPHEHIPSVRDLTLEHEELLSHMIATGKQLLAQEGVTDPTQFQLGFHRPPFASVKHLHLHCLGYPFVPSWNRWRFTKTFLGSYVDAESVLASLRSPPNST